MRAEHTDIRAKNASNRGEDSDLDLARAAAFGDEAAKRRLIEVVYDRIRRTLAYISNRADEVDDLTQNAAIEVLQSIQTYRGDAPLIHWAERIAVRTAAKHFDKRRRRARLFADMVGNLPSELEPSTDETAECREMLTRFQALFSTLGDNSRLALILHHVRGYPVAEIAAICRCSKFTVKGRLRRARRRLKREILRDEILGAWLEDKIDWGKP